MYCTFEQEVAIADLGNRDLLDGEFGGLTERVNRARRDICYASYLGIVERVHSLGRHVENFSWIGDRGGVGESRRIARGEWAKCLL